MSHAATARPRRASSEQTLPSRRSRREGQARFGPIAADPSTPSLGVNRLRPETPRQTRMAGSVTLRCCRALFFTSSVAEHAIAGSFGCDAALAEVSYPPISSERREGGQTYALDKVGAASAHQSIRVLYHELILIPCRFRQPTHDEPSPFPHQQTALLEHITAAIGLLDPAPDVVRERDLGQLALIGRSLCNPVPKGRPQTVRHGRLAETCVEIAGPTLIVLALTDRSQPKDRRPATDSLERIAIWQGHHCFSQSWLPSVSGLRSYCSSPKSNFVAKPISMVRSHS